jgi:SagB-type dehydrogenase family enzyme
VNVTVLHEENDVSLESDGRATARIHLWSLSEDVLVEDDGVPGQQVVITKWGETKIDDADDAVLESLRRMSLGPVSLDNVLAHTERDTPRPDGGGARAKVRKVLDLLSGSVVRSLGLSDGESPLLSAVPVARNATLRLPEVRHPRKLRLSRFAAMRAHEGELLLESPLARYDVLLHKPLAVQVVASLTGVSSITEVAKGLGAKPEVVADIVSYLVGTGVVLVGEQAERTRKPTFAEDLDPTLMRWSHHELLFHVRSRMGRYGGPSGAVFPHADRFPSPNLVKALRTGAQLPLYRPKIADLVAADPSLTSVLENPRLCTEISDRQLSEEEVGELLYRAARIRSVSSSSAGMDLRYDVSDRPYLSSHGLYELELYVVLHNCAGLPRGIYHYDPANHALTLVNDSLAELDELLDGARVAARTAARPPMLITMTARIARSSWMYGGIGYSLTLAHVGALQQTLCLVANAMGLAACAPAIDPGDVMDQALRLDIPAEVGVGEFIVG